jgi:hypothetical protein
MRPELESALQPVLRDRTHLADAFEIRDEDWVGEEYTLSAWIYSGRTGTGIYVLAAGPLPEQVASLADQIQEHVIEEIRAAWPQCPQPPANHPLE